MSVPKTAFVLGAGRGTRLRPRTNSWPKPLLELAGRPVITYAFDHLIDAGIERIIINTHHCAPRYAEVFPESTYRGIPLLFRHEPTLLDTAGGIKNIEDLLNPDEPLVVYNGDVVSTLPLSPLIERSDKAEVVLVLRSHEPRHVAMNPDGFITDIRNSLGTDADCQFCFSGIYTIQSSFFSRLQCDEPESVVPVFLRMIEEGNPPAGIQIDQGLWSDIGTEASFLSTEKELT
jgi:mannose-1-phosphate guanylyltransferase